MMRSTLRYALVGLGAAALALGFLAAVNAVDCTWDVFQGRGLPQAVYFPAIELGFSGRQFFAAIWGVTLGSFCIAVVLFRVAAWLRNSGVVDQGARL